MRSDHTSAPLVSVIIPVYNGQDFITHSVRSALRQSYSNIEVIVVDDGSTDASTDCLSRIHDPRLKVIQRANQGAAAARNYAVSQSTGTFLAFLDADDIWFPDFIERSIDAIRKADTGDSIAYSGYYCVDERRNLIKASSICTISGDMTNAVLGNEGLLLNSITLMHRTVFDRAGGFPDTLRHHEDRVFYIRSAMQAHACPTGRRLAIYRQSRQGKARRVLDDTGMARGATRKLAGALVGKLDAEQQEVFEATCINGLFCRFVMYGFPVAARDMLPDVRIKSLIRKPKGWLALFSAITRINALYAGRLMQQAVFRQLAGCWWRRKSLVAYKTVDTPPDCDDRGTA